MNGTWIYNWWHSRVPIIVCLSRIRCLVIFYMTTKVLNGNTCQTVKLKMSCIFDPVKNVMKWLECHLIFISWNIVSFSWAWMPSHIIGLECHLIFMGLNVISYSWAWMSSNIHRLEFHLIFTLECHLVFIHWNVISYSWAWMSSHIYRLECYLIFIEWNVISYSWDWMSSRINGLGLWC
jgi:hypothetical protein